jgi:hypothetical protein
LALFAGVSLIPSQQEHIDSRSRANEIFSRAITLEQEVEVDRLRLCDTSSFSTTNDSLHAQVDWQKYSSAFTNMIEKIDASRSEIEILQTEVDSLPSNKTGYIFGCFAITAGLGYSVFRKRKGYTLPK